MRQITIYRKTKPAHDGLKTAKKPERYREAFHADLTLYEAAVRYFRERGLKKLPATSRLQAENEALISEKNGLYHRIPGAESQSRRAAKGQIQPCRHAPAGTDKRGAPGLGAVRVFRFVPHPYRGKGFPFWTPLCYGKLTAELNPQNDTETTQKRPLLFTLSAISPTFFKGHTEGKIPENDTETIHQTPPIPLPR